MAYSDLGQVLGQAVGQVAGSFVPIPGSQAAGGTLIGGLGNYLGGLFDKPTQRRGSAMASNINVPQQQGNWFTGYQGQAGQIPRFTPEQQSALNQLLQQGMSNADFGNIERQARTQFQTQTIPSIAERFAGAAAGPGGSSRFRGALGAAGAGLEQNLAALRSQFGLQQLKMGLQPSFENIYLPGQIGAGNILAQVGGEEFIKFLPQLIEWLKSTYNQQPQSSIPGLEPLPNIPTENQIIGTGMRAIQQNLGTRPYQL